MGHERDREFTTTLARGIDILACFRADRPVLANKDFAQQTGLSRSAVARLTHTLVELGFLQREGEPARYRLGASVLALSYPLLASMQIRQLARPLMKQLADHARGAVSLVVRDRLQMVYVETARSNEALQTRPDIGASLPLLSSAAGKAWLARAPDEERAAVLNQLRIADAAHYEAHFPTLAGARRDLERKGYCGNNQQWRPDAYGFAAPLSRPHQSLLYVFNCGVPASDGPYRERAADIGPRLVALARETERLLGYS
ncbi:IclR family transcriptional regulator [Achromobacter denitrificans]|jgi:DNA-binding IclR family transcriptional regulator|uniref:IclR family transcriptional regulator n=1 Tax=Achromobacter denitrificans TaxID=32002 RepID=UPI0007893613|nr:IclR family transcriptional regulator [Achromobacter denitrificans]MDF3848351.1 IclR family transcriptional regulator [Achromobacter denitrificans]OLU10241.1 IclR family transcriptional regulator [Achromobacter denitrificans]QKH43524.1 IclR family transcriptional regulator [Achromobacter denitrificans]QKH49335.1 IclR family transcriptional regulator [Achromobacter denitrificans]CAB3651860.1 HTH-type transcriptional regulator TsaQ1/TsaQ2 [Achromobacter denitrificans]